MSERETDVYQRNRQRVCEIYGVDPRYASVHHIVFRSEGGGDELSNLYPFPASGNNHYSAEHIELHRLAQKIEKERAPRGRSGLQLLYQMKCVPEI